VAPNKAKQPTSELEAVSLELDVAELVVVSDELAVCTDMAGCEGCPREQVWCCNCPQRGCTAAVVKRHPHSKVALTAIICINTPTRQILFRTQCQSASEGTAG